MPAHVADFLNAEKVKICELGYATHPYLLQDYSAIFIEQQGIVVAALAFDKIDKYIYVAMIAVAESHRNTGLSKRLMDAIDTYSKDHAFEHIEYMVSVNNQVMQGACARNGLLATYTVYGKDIRP